MYSLWGIADWGLSTPSYLNISKVIREYHIHKQDIPFLMLAGGDNFYFHGVESIQDSQWNSHWWTSLQSKLQCPFFVALGNHDYEQNPWAQIEYTYRFPQKQWYLPHFYYAVPSVFPHVHLIVLDTVLLCPSLSLHFGIPKWKIPSRERQEHVKWFQDTLKTFRQRYPPTDIIIVMGHYPIFSFGTHQEAPEMKTIIWPLLKQYHVSFYLFGHDHISQCFTVNSTTFIGMGATSLVSSQSDEKWKMKHSTLPSPHTIHFIDDSCPRIWNLLIDERNGRISIHQFPLLASSSPSLVFEKLVWHVDSSPLQKKIMKKKNN